MKALKNAYTLFAFAMVLTGCASFGNEKPDTFNQRLAYAYGVHTAVLEATTSAVTAGTISSADAEAVLKQADTARLGLDTAKAASEAGDEAGANSKLAIALTALTALQDYLRSHGAKP